MSEHALATVEKRDERSAMLAFEPGDLDGAYRLAKLLVQSRLLPRSVGTPEAALTIMLAGRELGLTAMQSLRSIHVIEGKPTLSADLMLALVKRSPECSFFRLVQTTGNVAEYETLRKGEPSPTRMRFTIEEAKAAGLVGKDNWRKYPAAMLRARCITALARAVYPDLAMGLYDPDEIVPAGAHVVPIVETTGTPVPHTADGEVVDGAGQDELCAALEAQIRSADTEKAFKRLYREIEGAKVTEDRARRLLDTWTFYKDAWKERTAEPKTDPPPSDESDELGGSE